MSVPQLLSVPNHVHRWRIGEPEGPTSTGMCLGCSAVRSFRNWIEDIDRIPWKDGDGAAERARSASA